MGKNNYPTADLNSLPKEYTKEIVESLMELYSKGRPKTDEEVEKRLDEYFELCEKTSIRPGIESMRMALAVSRQGLLNWENGIGCSERRQELIVRAKTFVVAFLEQLMLNNKIFPGSGIFFLKNWANYKDNVEISTIENNSISQLSREEIRTRYQAMDEFKEEPSKAISVDDL